MSGIIVYKKTDRAQTSAVTDVFDTTSKTRIKHTSTTNLDLLHGSMNMQMSSLFSTSVMVKRGDKYHMKGFALAPTFAQVEVFWWHFERRRTFTRSCACPSQRGFITLLADGLSWRVALLARDFPSIAPGMVAQKSGVAQHGRDFAVIWRSEQTRFSNMSAGVSILVNKILEAEARGKNIRCASNVARKSQGHQAPKLAT